MTRGRVATALLLLLAAGCHRPAADQPVSEVDDEAQAHTAAKTLDDLAAAERAAHRPLPRPAATDQAGQRRNP